MGRRIAIVVGVILLVALGTGGGFLVGRSVGASQANQSRGQFARARSAGQGDWAAAMDQTPQPGQPSFAGGMRAGGGGTVGTVESINGNTVVVSTQGGSVQVETTDSTLVQKFTSVDVGALEVGEQVMVSGTQNDDGSITARSIQSLRAFQAPQTDQQ